MFIGKYKLRKSNVKHSRQSVLKFMWQWLFFLKIYSFEKKTPLFNIFLTTLFNSLLTYKAWLA